MPRLQIFFQKVSAHVLLKLAVKGFIKSKKLENVAFLGNFFKAKAEDCGQKNLSANRFDIIRSCSITCYPEMSVHVLLKVTTNIHLKSKKSLKI